MRNNHWSQSAHKQSLLGIPPVAVIVPFPALFLGALFNSWFWAIIPILWGYLLFNRFILKIPAAHFTRKVRSTLAGKVKRGHNKWGV